MNRLLLSAISFWASITITPKKIVTYLEAIHTPKKENLAFVTQEALRVSCVQLRVRGYRSLRDFLSDMLRLAGQAVDTGAQLVVFPEYIGLIPGTLLPLFGRQLYWVMEGRTPDALEDVQLHSGRAAKLAESFQNYLYETYMYTFSTIARLLKVYVAAGSCVFYEEGKLYNRSILFGPDGEPVGAQDKTSSVNFDSAMGITPGKRVEVFDTPLGKLSIISGLDSYYFENYKIAAELGARIIIAPDARGGITRDLLRCRANESGVFVLYSCYCDPQNACARAAVLAPLAATTTGGGILAGCDNSKTGLVTARLNLEKLQRVRHESEPNPAFLEGDYLHSYMYCGKLPLLSQEPPDTRQADLQEQHTGMY